MPYDELEHCLEVGQEPFWGPLTWLTVACGVGVGFVGYVALGALGALIGASLGLALALRYRRVSGGKRLLLLLRARMRRGRILDLGVAPQQHAAVTYQVRRVVEGRPVVVIKRGRL